MATWTAITDTEVEAGKPAYASVALRQRDNLTALAEGDATVPEASKLTPGSFKQPTSATQTAVLAKQNADQSSTSAAFTTLFIGYIVVPGVYTVEGTVTAVGAVEVIIYKNDVAVSGGTATTSGTLNPEITCASGDEIKVRYRRDILGTSVTVADFELKTEAMVPIAQAQFFSA